jgi:hypothetical protein
MKQDEIIEMARQAGFSGLEQNEIKSPYAESEDLSDLLEAFAKLVAAKEREACAKSLENSAKATNNFQAKVLIEWCATHIRARGEA